MFDGLEDDAAIKGSMIRVAKLAGTYRSVTARPVLSAPGTAERPNTLTGALLDLDRFVHLALGVECPALVLVRPDGHLAFQAKLEDTEALRAFCGRVFGKAPGKIELA